MSTNVFDETTDQTTQKLGTGYSMAGLIFFSLFTGAMGTTLIAWKNAKLIGKLDDLKPVLAATGCFAVIQIFLLHSLLISQNLAGLLIFTVFSGILGIIFIIFYWSQFKENAYGVIREGRTYQDALSDYLVTGASAYGISMAVSFVSFFINLLLNSGS